MLSVDHCKSFLLEWICHSDYLNPCVWGSMTPIGIWYGFRNDHYNGWDTLTCPPKHALSNFLNNLGEEWQVSLNERDSPLMNENTLNTISRKQHANKKCIFQELSHQLNSALNEIQSAMNQKQTVAPWLVRTLGNTPLFPVLNDTCDINYIVVFVRNRIKFKWLIDGLFLIKKSSYDSHICFIIWFHYYF